MCKYGTGIAGGVEDFDKDIISAAKRKLYAVNLNDEKIKISEEHNEYKWISYDEARNL